MNGKRYLLLGGSGFVGVNLASKLVLDPEATVKIACRQPEKARTLADTEGVDLVRAEFGCGYDFYPLVRDVDVVVHLVSTTNPSCSNRFVPNELEDIRATAELLEACAAAGVERVVFISSGGTVYGKGSPPFAEDDPTWPISSYGLQKASIEKLMHLYNHLSGLDYRIVRPSNPYGPHQNPFGGQGAVAAFIQAALAGNDLVIFGDGEVMRDFIYIDDMVEGLLRIMRYEGSSRIFNLGSGQGTKIVDLANLIVSTIDSKSKIRFLDSRAVDVPESVLDMSLFEDELGCLPLTSLEQGVLLTAGFQRSSRKGLKDDR